MICGGMKAFANAIISFFRSIFCCFCSKSFKDVSNDVVLVTGGGSGIGALIAKKFANLGSTVIIWDINEAGMDTTKAEIEDRGGICHAFRVDVSNRKVVYENALKIRHDLGKDVDILVNNAGIVSGKRFEHLADEDIIRTMNVNAMAAFWTTRAFLPAMKKKNHGHIVNIASVAGLAGIPSLTDYSASKFALVGFSEALFQEIRADGLLGIKGTLVLPNLINTGLFQGAKLRFLEGQSPESVSQKIMEAILSDTQIIFLPSWLSLIFVLKSILPTNVMLLMADLFALNTFMDKFSGRRASNNN